MGAPEIVKILNEKGIKPSLSRIKIYQYLDVNRVHPTVEVIYNDLVKELITLSKTTVYNTLKLFQENNIIRVLNVGEGEQRYDLTDDNHMHFKCLKCGEI